jgi:hypothetical protein
MHDTTDANGAYSFSVPPGSYTVCEETEGHPGWVETLPTTGTGTTACPATHPNPGTPPPDNVSLASRGYAVTGGTSDLKDFGNTPESKVTVTFESLADLPGGGDATRATDITCVPGGGNEGSNSFTTSNLTFSDGPTDGQVVCTINYVDP